MAKQPIKYKVIRQSAEMGSKFYGVINNADPINAELTMEQIIDKRKLHNYSAKQLTVLMEEVLQGAAELVARDGIPRNLSTLLKFEARIRGTFANTESGITTQDILVKPRMLKDIKVAIDKNDFTFVNESGDTSPRVSSIALEADAFTGWNLAAFELSEGVYLPIGPLTAAGVRLAPDGWDVTNTKYSLSARRTVDGVTQIFRLDSYQVPEGGPRGSFISDTADVASENVLKFSLATSFEKNAWLATTDDPTVARSEAFIASFNDNYVPQVGDVLRFTFARQLGDGSGSIVMSSKEVTITA